MDNVSSIKFNYKMIRVCDRINSNIFDYAANLVMLVDDIIFFELEDVCIIDFLLQIEDIEDKSYKVEYKPIDADEVFLCLEKQGDYLTISSKFINSIAKVPTSNFVSEIYKLRDYVENYKKKYS